MVNISDHLTNISIVTYLIVFIGGVMTSFTPCVYPLIPIIVGVIGANKEQSRWRNFILSFIYVLGLAFTFSILGVVSALTGMFFGQIQNNPLTHIIVGIIIILFALVLLDVITLPTFLLNRLGLGKVSSTGTLISVFFMGATSGFVAAPCAVSILAVLLTYVATTQNIVLGFTLLFTFGIGLGVFLILVGTFAGILKVLPGSEKWMKVIQKGIAVGMIILGGYFIFKGGVLLR